MPRDIASDKRAAAHALFASGADGGFSTEVRFGYS
jgi:hypothetical protein